MRGGGGQRLVQGRTFVTTYPITTQPDQGQNTSCDRTYTEARDHLSPQDCSVHPQDLASCCGNGRPLGLLNTSQQFLSGGAFVPVLPFAVVAETRRKERHAPRAAQPILRFAFRPGT